MSELQEWIREPDYSEDFSLDEMIDWIERRPIAALAILENDMAQAVREREDYNGMHQGACLEIERLKQRVAVLEMVICEELADSGCQDSANEMILEEIVERLPPAPTVDAER